MTKPTNPPENIKLHHLWPPVLAIQEILQKVILHYCSKINKALLVATPHSTKLEVLFSTQFGLEPEYQN
jgi:hypothetical protein